MQYIVNLDTSTTSFTLAGSSFANETGSIPAYSPAQSSSSQQTPLTFTSSRMGGIGSSGVIVNDKVAMGSYAAFQNIEVDFLFVLISSSIHFRQLTRTPFGSRSLMCRRIQT